MAVRREPHSGATVARAGPITEGATRLTPQEERERERERDERKAGRPRYKDPRMRLGGGVRIKMERIRGLTDPDVLRIPFFFQTPPLENFTRSASFSHTDYETLAGQFSRPGVRQLRTISFNTLFVDYDASWTFTHPRKWQADKDPHVETYRPNPIKLTRELHKIMFAGTPFRLVAETPDLWNLEDVNMPVTLRSIEAEERAGEVDARYVNVSFVEYRDAKIGRRQLGGGGGGGQDNLPATVIVQSDGSAMGGPKPHKKLGTADDPATLAKIAKHYYGSGGRKLVALIAKKNNMDWAANRSLGPWAAKKGGHRKLIVPPNPDDGSTGDTGDATRERITH